MKSVAINGYGTIGKRVADAVAAQDDMKVIGVSKTRPNYEARTAVEEKGYDLYIGIPERANQFKEAGIEIAGTVEDMIQEADVVVDCTPGTIGPQNLEMYKKAGVKAIYQGGEDHELTGLSFNAISSFIYHILLSLESTLYNLRIFGLPPIFFRDIRLTTSRYSGVFLTISQLSGCSPCDLIISFCCNVGLLPFFMSFSFHYSS